MNARGTVAMRVLFEHMRQGIVRRTPDGRTALLAGEGLEVDLRGDPPEVCDAPEIESPAAQVVTELGEVVAIDDADTVAFVAGTFLDPTRPEPDASDPEAQSPANTAHGLFVHQAGTLRAVALPWRRLCSADGARGPRLTGLTLDGEVGGDIAPPALTPAGDLVFLAELDGGARMAVLRATPPYVTLRTCVVLEGGARALAGGAYRIASTAPVVDADGTLTFGARLAGSAVSETLVRVDRECVSPPEPIVAVGSPLPGGGVHGGDPFSPPVVDDAGDVVFRAFVEGAAGSLGLFRYRDGVGQRLVRVGAHVSVGPGEPRRVAHLPADPDVNEAGEVVFAAVVEDLGRVAVVADAEGRLVNGIGRGAAAIGAIPGDVGRLRWRPALDDASRTIAVADLRISASGRVRRAVVVGSAESAGVETLAVDDTHVLSRPIHRACADALDADAACPLHFLRFYEPGVAGDAAGLHLVFSADLAPRVLDRQGERVLAREPAVRALAYVGRAGRHAPILIPLVAERDVVDVTGVERGGATRLQVAGVGALAPAVGPDGSVAALVRVTNPDASDPYRLAGAILHWTTAGSGPRVLARVGAPGPGDAGDFGALGPPATNRVGEIAFKATFHQCGSRNGYLVSAPDGSMRHAVARDDVVTDAHGELGQRIALNVHGALAFTATPRRGRPAIMMAVPAAAPTLPPICHSCPIGLTAASVRCRVVALETVVAAAPQVGRPRQGRRRALARLDAAGRGIGVAVSACAAGEPRTARRLLTRALRGPSPASFRAGVCSGPSSVRSNQPPSGVGSSSHGRITYTAQSSASQVAGTKTTAPAPDRAHPAMGPRTSAANATSPRPFTAGRPRNRSTIGRPTRGPGPGSGLPRRATVRATPSESLRSTRASVSAPSASASVR